MHRFILAIAVSTALMVSGPAYAQKGHGGGKPTTSHSPSTTHGNSGATTHGNSGATTHGKSGATTHGQSGSHATKTTTGGSTKHASTAGTTTPSSNTSTSSSNTTTSTTTAGSTTTLTPVQQKLQKNTNLADKLRTRLPDGTDLMKAAEGFKNLGQFVAAVNVSNNHEGVTFTELKTRMVDEGMSLGQALQDVKKTANVETEVKRAEAEADAMIKSTTTTSTTNTTTTSTTTKKTPKTKSGSTENK